MGWLGKKYIAFVGAALVVLAGLLLLNWYDYLLFHTVAELFSIVVAGCVFIISWNSREFQDSSAFTLLGIAFLCFGLLDGVHTLAYKGMPFFPGYDANLPTQLWIAARYMEAASLFAFSMLLGRTFNVRRVFCGYLVATGVLLALIFGRWFPDCFIPGQGLTGFKIGSEYLIVGLLAASIAVLRRQKRFFAPHVYRLIVWGVASTIVAEILFTFYIDVYDLSNVLGHYLKIVSFYLVYKALVTTGLKEPHALLYRQLKESEERYNSLTQNLSGIVYRCHLDWSLVYIGGAFAEITGYSEAELHTEIGYWERLVYPQDLAIFNDPDTLEALQARAGFQACREYRIVRKDGQRRWILECLHNVCTSCATPAYIEAVLLDISVQKHNESQLETFKRCVENSPMSIVITDTQGHIEYVNPAFTQITGYTREEALGATPRILKSGEHGPDFYAQLWQTLLAGKTWRGEICNRKKDGTLFWEQAAIAPVKEGPERFSQYVAVKEDVTGRKELERLKADVERIMRHDLKTPLNGLLGLPQVLLLDDNFTAEQREMLHSIERSARHMLRMINLSLDMFKMETGAYTYVPQQVQLVAVLFQVLSDLEPRRNVAGVQVAVTLDGEPADTQTRLGVWAEERLLYSMFSNLLANAIEASPAEDLVAVDISRTEAVEVCIRNRGAVPERIRERFFEKYNSYGKKAGTGLGTYSAKIMAETMQFHIRMQTDDVADMTWVTIVIPLANNAG